MNTRKLYENAYRMCRDDGGENLDGDINAALNIGLITELDAAKAHIVIGWAITSYETRGTPDHYEHWTTDTRYGLRAKRFTAPLVQAFTPLMEAISKAAEAIELMHKMGVTDDNG